ncbi:sec-independent protein translocase protein TatC [Ereboglobus sp. PH5-5]|uniref:twin-arginine translocase subunit TatC n=1 Tax=Ereboglobus sp. PH5-5 TaxID=2940529 RepID=UPI00240597A6|nr:twin-arginine translocase subunit TatC [Ereboglobus sp. PH5-5]MDF9834278.1 sec-independent protein translocase protein TatC [Ereboglobus sp. PH5-5]
MSQNDDNNDDDIYEADGSLPEDVMDPREKPMGFFDHLEELRWVILKCIVVYVLFAVVIGVFLRQANSILLLPFNMAREQFPELPENLRMIYVTDSFTAVIQLCFLGALVPAMPFFFFFASQFVAPALTKKEKHMIIPVCLSSLVLFVVGSLFSFLLLVPSTLKISALTGDILGATAEWTIASYYGTLAWLTIGVGISFEFPLVIVLLVYLGILRVETLRKYRRHAIVGIFIMAAIITPTPDPFTQTIFALPLYVLFETAIFIGGRMQKKRDEAAQAQ